MKRFLRICLALFALGLILTYVIPSVVSYVFFHDLASFYKAFLKAALRPGYVFNSIGLMRTHANYLLVAAYCSLIWSVILTIIWLVIRYLIIKICELYDYRF